MHAAALGGASMRDVHAWVSNPDPHYNKVREMLDASPEAAGFGHELEHFVQHERPHPDLDHAVDPPGVDVAARPGRGPRRRAAGDRRR